LANNTTLPGDGDVIRDIDRGSYKTQVVILDINGGGGSEQLMTPGQTTMANSIPVAVASNQSAIPATAYNQSSTVYIGTTAYTVKRAKIGITASGANTLVAAVTAKVIRVLAMHIIAEGSVSVYFYNASASTGIWGDSTNTISLVAGVPYVLPPNQWGWFETSAVTELLAINLSQAVIVSGGLVYIEV